MQSSDLAASAPPMAGMAMNQEDMAMEGYFPDSSLAQYASAMTLLLAITGVSVFAALEFGNEASNK